MFDKLHSGLADPAPVAQTFFIDEDIRSMYNLDGIITVVDAKHIIERLDDKKPEGVENEAVEQVAFADRILLNKVDLLEDVQECGAAATSGDGAIDCSGPSGVIMNKPNLESKTYTKADIIKRLKAINSDADIVECTYGQVPINKLVDTKSFSLDRVLDFEPDFLEEGDGHEHEHDDSVSSCSCKFEGELNFMQLQRFIGNLLRSKGADLFRYKGVFAVRGADEKYVFQGVGMLFNGNFSDLEWQKDEVRECRFVFIGRNLNKEELIEGIKACQQAPKLRFDIGDSVLALTAADTWSKGKVIRHWDAGNPYRIELEDGRNVWGPIDSDVCVRTGVAGA